MLNWRRHEPEPKHLAPVRYTADIDDGLFYHLEYALDCGKWDCFLMDLRCRTKAKHIGLIKGLSAAQAACYAHELGRLADSAGPQRATPASVHQIEAQQKQGRDVG